MIHCGREGGREGRREGRRKRGREGSREGGKEGEREGRRERTHCNGSITSSRIELSVNGIHSHPPHWAGVS